MTAHDTSALALNSETQESQGTLRQRVATIAHRLTTAEFGPGALASLRRGDAHTVLAQPAFHRLTASFDDRTLSNDGALRWATVVQCLALIGGATGTLPSDGYVLAESGLSESRLTRLLAAKEGQLRDQLSLVARYLRSKGTSLGWLDLATVVLLEGRAESRAEEARLRIARDYYRVLARRSAP